MKFKIICGFKNKQGNFKDFEAQILKRISSHYSLEIEEISLSNKIKKDQIKTEQSKLLANKLTPGAFHIILTEHGKTFSSQDIAQLIETQQINSIKQIEFVIGGPYGIDPNQFKSSSLFLSISSMTFTSELCRLILIEQLYRAVSIIKNLPYHKE